MSDEWNDNLEALAKDHLAKPVCEYVDAVYTPSSLCEVVALLNVSAKLVETAAYGAAGKVPENNVVGLCELASRLDTQAKILGGQHLS